MTRLKMSILALVLAALAPSAALAQVKLTGDWTVTVESPQGAASIDLSVKQTGEDLTGTITSPMGSVDFKGKVVKDALTVTYAMNLQGNTIQITMTGTATADAIVGNLNFGGLGDIPWSAKRKGAAGGGAAAAAPSSASADSPAAEALDVSGKWDVTFNIAGNPMPASASFTQAGDKVTGTISSQAGDTAITGTMSGKALKLEFNVETPQGQISITMTGDVGPGGIMGKAMIVGLGDTEWTATRAR